jgi:hypothetical protein
MPTYAVKVTAVVSNDAPLTDTEVIQRVREFIAANGGLFTITNKE